MTGRMCGAGVLTRGAAEADGVEYKIESVFNFVLYIAGVLTRGAAEADGVYVRRGESVCSPSCACAARAAHLHAAHLHVRHVRRPRAVWSVRLRRRYQPPLSAAARYNGSGPTVTCRNCRASRRLSAARRVACSGCAPPPRRMYTPATSARPGSVRPGLDIAVRACARVRARACDGRKTGRQWLRAVGQVVYAG
jgi:hypothetical protein